MDPTEMTPLALAGEIVQESVAAFPDATATGTPAAVKAFTAAFNASDFGPAMDKLKVGN